LAEGKQENWITWVALTTAIMAVLAAVTTLYVGKYSSRAVLLQGQESNQWAYYQAKSIKGYLYEVQQNEMELLLLQPKVPSAVSGRCQKITDEYAKSIKRYEAEKAEIKTKAEKLARDKQLAQDMAGNFGYSLIFLQIAIMLSSLSAITKKKPLWYFGMAVVVGWLFFFLDAIFLFY
jgi:uncharacterized membrane protein